MKILVAGDWHSELHEEAVYRAFQALGHNVCRFSWYEYFVSSSSPLIKAADTLLKKFQNKYTMGPLIWLINRDLIKAVDACRPDILFIYRGTHITRNTLQRINKDYPSTILIGYNNDDPFAEGHSYWLWRHFLSSIPEYDMTLAYRQHNLEDFRKAGAKRVHLLRSWFIPERNHSVILSAEDQRGYKCDVVFIGHYEPDGRLEMLEEIVRHGLQLRLYGPGYDWDPVIRQSSALRNQIPVQLVWGQNYNKALCGAKVALCFLSKLNRDTYTRRCFEIPATGTLMLSEYSDELAALYREGEEADFFRSKEDLVQKLRRYIQDDHLRESVAKRGYQRVIADGHDVVSRMKQVLEWVNQLNLNYKVRNNG